MDKKGKFERTVIILMVIALWNACSIEQLHTGESGAGRRA